MRRCLRPSSTSWSAGAPGGHCRRALDIEVDRSPQVLDLVADRGVGWLHEEILHRLDDTGLLDLSRVVLHSAHVRAKRGANTQVQAPWTGASRAPRCTSCRTRTDCPSSSASQPPTPTTAKG